MVDDGTWTIDKMFSLAISGSRDLDGDTKIKDGDIYGYITDKWMCYDAFIHSCDIKITERDKNGTPILIGLTERYIDAEKKISEFMNGSGVVRTKGDQNGDLVTFGNGEAFFYPSALGGAFISLICAGLVSGHVARAPVSAGIRRNGGENRENKRCYTK